MHPLVYLCVLYVLRCTARRISCTEQITQIEAKRTLLKDIFDIRMSKLRSSIDLFVKSDAKVAKLTHLTRFELNTVREFLSGAMDTLSSLAQLEDEADERASMSVTSGGNATQSNSASFFERRDTSFGLGNSTTAHTRSPNRASGAPITAASRTAG